MKKVTKNKLLFLKKWKITTKNYTGNLKNTSSEYSIKCLCNLKLSESIFIAINFFLKRTYKKKTSYNYKINKQQTLSSKSLGMRMGKGKGSKKKLIYLINTGDFFLDIKKSNIRSKKDFNLFRSILKKKITFLCKI